MNNKSLHFYIFHNQVLSNVEKHTTFNSYISKVQYYVIVYIKFYIDLKGFVQFIRESQNFSTQVEKMHLEA